MKKQSSKKQSNFTIYWLKKPVFVFYIALAIFIILAVLKIAFINDGWFDPFFSLEYVHQNSVVNMFVNPVDVHPPLYYATLKGWLFVFGESVFAARMLSVCFGVLFFIILFNIISRWFDRNFAQYAILFMVLLSVNLNVFTEIRMYSMALFLTAAGFLSLLKIKEMDIWTDNYVLLWFVFVVLSVWTHYYTVFFHLMSFVYIWLFRKQDLWKSIKIYLFYAWPFAIPLILFFLTQLSKIDGMWFRGVSYMSFFSSLYYAFFHTNVNLLGNIESIYGFIFVIALFAWNVLYIIKFAPKWEKKILFFLFVMGVLPQILGLVINEFYKVYHHRFFIFTLWAWVLLSFRSVTSSYVTLTSRRVNWRFVQIYLLLFVLLIVGIGLVMYFQTANTELESMSKQVNVLYCNSSLPIIHESPFSSVVSQYYLRIGNCSSYVVVFSDLTTRQFASAGGAVISEEDIIRNTKELENYDELLYYKSEENDLLNWTNVIWNKTIVIDLDGLDLIYARQIKQEYEINLSFS